VSERPEGYHDIPEADQKKAKVFFDYARTADGTGNYEYAIDMMLQGLGVDPDARSAHQALRDIAMKRKASGGKDLGMMEKMKLKRPTKDDRQNMLNAEKLLSYEPGNPDHMVTILQNAHKAGFYDTVMWIGPILLRANADSKNPDVNKFLILKDVYKDLRQWKAATEACHYALRLDEFNMDLQTELKNLGAQDTMDEGNYTKGGSFRESLTKTEEQDRLIQESKDVQSNENLMKSIADAEAGYNADPVDGKLLRLVELLEKTEDVEHENRAMELLEDAFNRTKQFRFRQRVGKIQIAQMLRSERTFKKAIAANPQDAQARRDYEEFKKEQLEFELKEYTLWAENYPTDLTLRYAMALRLFALKQYNDAIPVFQQARQDPKVKVEASIALGQSFLEAGYVDEAIETLQAVIDEYQLKGDDKSKLMYYWQGRALQQKGNTDLAIKRYSQVAQWEFTYKDVQGRIKDLRNGR
jgi:thioredoxin-like negative regulator of GroEL